MKGNNIDELFRQKLSHQKTTPPSNAWEKIEGNLEGKKKGVYFWLSIAASIVIVFTIGGILLTRPSKQQQYQAKNTPKEQSLEKEQSPKEKPQNQTQTTTQQEVDQIDQQEEETVAPIQQLSSSPQLVASLDQQPSVKNLNKNLTEVNHQVLQLEKIDINLNLKVNSLAQIKHQSVMPITLTDFYSNQIYNEEIETTKKKKFSVLDGIISVAKGVHTAKETISELRTTKNEFVSSELKYGNTESEPQSKSGERTNTNQNTTNSQFE